MTIKVTLDGVTQERALVSLTQVSGEGHTAVGTTDAAGIATIKSTEGWNGVFPGEYTVTIKKVEMTTSSTPPKGAEVDRTSDGGDENAFVTMTDLLPKKYGSTKTSELKVTQESKAGAFEFDLSE